MNVSSSDSNKCNQVCTRVADPDPVEFGNFWSGTDVNEK
jgi:hypothetical protein